MQDSIHSICPRCEHRLAILYLDADQRRAAVLTCPEAYCDYVLVLERQESVFDTDTGPGFRAAG
jgi:hypothetical protein